MELMKSSTPRVPKTPKFSEIIGPCEGPQGPRAFHGQQELHLLVERHQKGENRRDQGLRPPLELPVGGAPASSSISGFGLPPKTGQTKAETGSCNRQMFLFLSP